MKSISDTFKTHIQGEVTTVCTCVNIIRRDGASFGLTDHDDVVTVNGVRYLPFNSYARSSVQTTSTMEVDSMEINGILNSDAFARTDIGGGLFDFAEVHVFIVNYNDPDSGQLNLRTGWIGEIEQNEDNSFHAEIRGLSQVFSYRLGEPYAPECAADLGDNRCKIALDPPWWKALCPFRAGDVVIGHITSATDYVNADSSNNDFSSQSDGTSARLPDDWVTYGSPDGQWFFSSSFHGLTSPPGGSLFAAITDQFGTNDTEYLGMYQDVDLVASGLVTADIDTGLCRIVFKGWVGLNDSQGLAQLRLFAVDAGGVLTNVWDTGIHAYAQDRWITLSTDSTLIPAGTRKIRVDFMGKKHDHLGYGAAFGGYQMAFNDPDGTFNSDDQASGVMFQAQNGGVTGGTEPAFSALLGATYTDGTITWKCIKSFKDVTTVTSPTSGQAFTATLPHPDGYYDGGLLIWETGLNTGRNMQVRTWLSGTVTLFERTFFEITAGDRFVIHPGCDKRRETCIGTFNNLLNIRAFPDVPGQDAYMQTPNAPSN